MAADTSSSLSELKQLLVTGTNNAAWSGNHLVRHLVDWYQRNERENRNNPALTDALPDDESARIRTCNPCDSLIYSTAVIPKLVSEGKADIIIDTLRSYSQLPYVDKEALVMCLAVASKQAEHKKLVTRAGPLSRARTLHQHPPLLPLHPDI
ncbi:uncharacterized protein LOC122248177 [Penaeus japonicus]|uniref:uncharacterized protein LOC122248177 n=1 Tax=Penaeus japonicus TaxID=27405 RepID=UPI001C70CC9B|nr:uncharacterized protein LOC122248177 [Penaeus japonicus]